MPENTGAVAEALMSEARPREWYEPAPLAAWLGHGVSAELVGQMFAYERLRTRLSGLLDGRLGVSAPSPVLELDAIGLAALVRQLGAIWNAPDLIETIDGQMVRQLVAAVGPSLRQVAIRHAGLLPAFHARRRLSASELAHCIPLDGAACLLAWADTQPVAIQRRIRLRVVDHTPLEQAHRTHAPGLVAAFFKATAPVAVTA